MCFASVLAARGDGGGQPSPAQPGPATTKGPCRTYDTAVTSVTSGGPMTATVDWTGVFDPWSLRFVQNINFSSNQGAHFSYVQVSTWASLEDFIAEVVRLKPPATLATNPNGPVQDIVPPLMRSLSTTGNGVVALTKTNSYDSTGRLTGSVARNAGGTITQRYTAWDAVGRPTAGTMQSPVNTSTLSYSYDDKTLTETQTTTTRGITSVISSTYDQFGNMRASTASVSGGQGSTTTFTSHGTAKVCLGDTKAPAVPALKPAGPNPAGTFSGTIGGQSWSAAAGMQAQNTGSVVSVGGSDNRFIVSIGLSAKSGPGQFQAGSLANEDFTKLTPAQFTNLIDRNSVVATVFDTQTKQSWQASPTTGSGTVNLTSVAGTVAGTFSLTLDPVPGTGASGSINFSGAFNIKY
jgi:hypothetical protein